MSNKKTSVTIIVAAHKKYWMPDDSMYLPLHVGAEGKKINLGYQKDNEGENISDLNSSFCELTGLYWAWKNLDSDYIGLSHYRRQFCMKRRKNVKDSVLTYAQLKPYLGSVRIFVPNKRRYFIESLYSHYKHTHYAEHLDIVRDIISEKYPDYLDSFDRVMKRTYGYMFNMMIMKKDLLNDYCTWLFDILFKAGERISEGTESAYQGRYFGRISEIIFNVWIDHQIEAGLLRRKEIKEIRCIHMEKVNWLSKGTSFIEAKFIGKKYKKSF